MIITLFKGILIGFAVAMPVGPIGILCIKNSLIGGKRYGFATGLGAALADTLFAAIAGFGVVALTSLLMNYHDALKVLGGFFLLYLGITTFFREKEEEKALVTPTGLFKVFLTTFFLTLTNPLTILSFIAIYAALGIGIQGINLLTAFLLTLGVFIGSALWWLLLSSVSSFFKHRMTHSVLKWLDLFSGGALILLGIIALLIV